MRWSACPDRISALQALEVVSKGVRTAGLRVASLLGRRQQDDADVVVDAEVGDAGAVGGRLALAVAAAAEDGQCCVDHSCPRQMIPTVSGRKVRVPRPGG